jgi:hypothetical protein
VADLDTTNRFAVGASPAGGVHVLGLVVLADKMRAGGLTAEEGINLAAWIVAMVSTADPAAPAKFEKLYSAIMES